MYDGHVPAPNAAARSYAQLCGIATALDVIGDRWALLIVRDLMLGPLRFGDLADGLPGVGTNTLTARLKQLEAADVIERRLMPAPGRATVYQLTAYGHDLEPILLALGCWGTRSMDRLPGELAVRSRWLVAGMLAFQNRSHRATNPTMWELRLTDGPFTVRVDDAEVTVAAGAPEQPDHSVTINDGDLHLLLTGRLEPADAVARGVCEASDEDALPDLLELFAFPALGAVAES